MKFFVVESDLYPDPVLVVHVMYKHVLMHQVKSRDDSIATQNIEKAPDLQGAISTPPTLEAAAAEKEALGPPMREVDIADKDSVEGYNQQSTSGPLQLVRVIVRRVQRGLSSLPLALAELVACAVLSSFGTIIEQGQSIAFYAERYPEEAPALGFLSYKVIKALQLDHIYTAPYFLGLIALLFSSLVACSVTTQWPMFKVARRWRFAATPAAIDRLDFHESLPNARVSDVALALLDRGYQVGSLSIFRY